LRDNFGFSRHARTENKKGIVYADSFTVGGEEFVPQIVSAFARAHVLTPYSLSITGDFDLVSK